MPDLDWTDMPIHQAIKADWTSPEILIEGSLNSAKSTLFLDKEIDALFKWPGIPILLFRWLQDSVDTKLRPAFEEILAIRGIPLPPWDNKEKCFTFPNGSRVYLFGLKAVSLVEQYNKIRGLGVSRIAGDQIEEVPPQIGAELRGRTRPGLTATMQNKLFPFQITFVSNSEDDDFWLSKEFPTDQHIKGRTLYQVSVFDNKHAPPESIETLLRQFPEDHPKHRTMVLGRRGPNVYGVPVFEGLYRKDLHWRPTAFRHDLPILESFHLGKHNPTFVCAQALYAGGLAVQGGVLALGMVLEDFVPIVDAYRRAWYPPSVPVKSCVAPQGEKTQQTTGRFTGNDVFREKAGIKVQWQDTGNAPDVRLAMIENLSSYLRRRNARGEESFAINTDPTRFLIVSQADGVRESPIVHHAFEGGAVWDAHFVSVSHKELRHIREDDKFANVLNCLSNIELNFCAGQRTAEARALATAQARAKTRGLSHILTGPDSWMS